MKILTKYVLQCVRETLELMDKFELISIEKRNYEFITVRQSQVHDDMFDFLCELFYPFVDSFWLTATTLFTLQNQRAGVMERMLVERTQWFGEKSYFERVTPYFDATSKECIRVALKVFMKSDIISVDDSTCITLSENTKANPEILRSLTERIASYRKPANTSGILSFARL